MSQLGSCIIYKVASHSTQAKPLYHGHSVQRELLTVKLSAIAENMLQKIAFDSYISSIEINEIRSN